MDEIEILRKKLYKLLSEGKVMSGEDVLKVSQELDKLIADFYLGDNDKSKLVSGF